MATLTAAAMLRPSRWSTLQPSVPTIFFRSRSTITESRPKTAVLMMNMGGPSTPEETGPFLHRLFNDNDIIEFGGGMVQRVLGTFIAKRRTPKVQAQYEEIGGSPIRKWSEHQGEEMCKLLDAMRPESAPHKAYVGFRYAHPLTEEALQQMKADGVKRAIAFSQFPQWSCTTSGSSMNDLWRNIKKHKMENDFQWSLIDRWPLHEGFINSVTDRIREGLEQFPVDERDKVVLLFSAHSVPMKVVNKADHYVNEVSATVKLLMENLTNIVKTSEEGAFAGVNKTLPHVLAWQSKVGFLPWMVPKTSDVIEALGKRNVRHVLVVPVAFTSDHIETTFEIGIEYAEDAEKAGITNFKCTEGLNGSPIFIKALADIVSQHLDSGELYSPQYKIKCMNCEKPFCRQIVNPAPMEQKDKSASKTGLEGAE